MKETEDSEDEPFADDAVLIANSEDCLQRIMNEMGVVCERRKLKVSVNKSSYESV